MQTDAISSLRISGVSVPNVLRLDQIKAFGKHTVATLDVQYPRMSTSPTAAPWVAPEMSPVEMRLAGNDWYGYVHHGGVVSDVRDAAGSCIRYTLIGTSLPMNEERTRSWRATSASALVRTIANEHRLRSLITPHKSIIGYYAQAGSSDWKVLQDMAKRTGYRLWVDGSTVLFVSPSILLQGVRDADIPLFSQSFTPGIVDNLYKFSSKAGTLVPRPGGTTTKQIVHGIDPRTGRLVKATGATNLGVGAAYGPTPLLTRIGSVDTSISGLAAATDTVAAQISASKGWITATAIVRGSAGIVPGAIVRIGGSAVPADQQGRWLVTSVNHRVLNDNSALLDPFTTTLELERDRFYGPSFVSAFKVSNTRDAVPAKIRNGILWESEILESINVG